MTRWTVTFQDSPEMGRVRADKARRAAHVEFVASHPELDIGGPMALHPMQDFPGAIWTVEAEERADVERLILRDPFFVRSLRSYRIMSFQHAGIPLKTRL